MNAILLILIAALVPVQIIAMRKERRRLHLGAFVAQFILVLIFSFQNA